MITRDNRYIHARLPLVVDITAAEEVGIDVKICKKCGSIVQDTRVHNQWHKDLEKS